MIPKKFYKCIKCGRNKCISPEHTICNDCKRATRDTIACSLRRKAE